jgi:CshA-type fibril repeat protein
MLETFSRRAMRRITALLVATCSVGVVAFPSAVASAQVTPLASGDPTLTLTKDGVPAVALAANDTLRAVTDAPIALAGQTTQTIEQTWDSSALRLSEGAITSPEAWPLEYTTDSTTWSSSVPSDLSAVRGVRTTGAVSSLGYSSGLQSTVSTSDGAVRVPTVSSISVTGLGDGWDVFFDEYYTKVFNVFHHSSPAQIDCHSLFDGTRCAGYPVAMPSSLGTNDRSTGISVGSKVWVAAGRGSNPGGGFACFNVSGGPCSTPFVKLASNSLNGSYNNVVNMARAGQYVFTQNRSDGKLLCLDTTTSTGCSSMPAGGFDLGHGVSSNYKSTLLTVGSRVYSHDGTGEVGCLDTTTWALCTGWATTWSSNRDFQLAALPNASGAIAAVCTFNNAAATCVDAAQQPYAHPTSFNTTLNLSPAMIEGYGKAPETSGTRIYWSDANYLSANGEISCWDAAANAGAGATCANFPLLDENYTVVVDPQNADCIWTNDNDGSIEAFDVTTGAVGCPVDPDPVIQLPYTTTVPRLACAEEGRVRSWTTFKAITPVGIAASDLRVTVKRNGVKVSGWENLTPDGNGEIDLSTLTVGQTSTQPMFEVKVIGATVQDADFVTADITYLSDAPQLCVDLAVLRECPTGSGIAPAGALALNPAAVGSTVTNDSGVSTVIAPLSSTATRADVASCQGALSGTVLRTPPSGSYPIVKADVTLRDGSGNTIDTTTTDLNGDYTFPSLYAGNYTVAYNTTTESVSIAASSTTTQNFSIPVGLPIANDVTAVTDQNVPVTFDFDAAADPLTSIDDATFELRLDNNAWGATVAVPNEGTWDVTNGRIRFTPAVTFHGAATPVEYRVSDGYANIASAQARVTVAATAGIAEADTASGVQGVTLHLDAAASAGAVAIDYTTVELAADEAGTYSESLTLSGVGSFTPNAAGHVVFVPGGAFTGTRTVSYRVRDAAGRWAASTFTVTLTAAAISGSTDIVQPATSGALPVSGVPAGAVVSVPASVSNAKTISFANGSVLIEPVAGFSGIIRVPVTATLGTATFTTYVVLTVLPKAPAKLKVSNTPTGSVITWPVSATTNATGYVVRVNGLELCTVTAETRTCVYPGLIGPRTVVEVKTLGADETVSGYTANTPAKARCQKVASVHFATDSARLTDAAKRKLRSVATTMRTQRFTGYCISGHTDARGTFSHNDSLSYFRARAVAQYLNLHLPVSMRQKAAYSGEYRPVGSNKTKPGMASNRRVDIAVS